MNIINRIRLILRHLVATAWFKYPVGKNIAHLPPQRLSQIPCMSFLLLRLDSQIISLCLIRKYYLSFTDLVNQNEWVQVVNSL
jgi:hypothetical protein